MKKKLKILFFSIFTVLCVFTLESQDPIFSQFYSSPLHINPAFTGKSYAPVIHLNSRIEWPMINFAYNTYAISVDRFFEKKNFGAGLIILVDDSGNGIYRRFRSEGMFSYRLKAAENKYFKMGLGFAYGQNTLDWNKLVFGDMIDALSGFTLPDGSPLITEEIMPEDLTKRYFDLSAGLLYYSRSVYIGIAIKHANTPDNYYFNQNSDGVNKGLPMRFTAQIGGEIQMFPDDVYHKSFYSPGLLYVFQSGLHQLTFNNYFDLGGFFGGLGYRFNITNSDAVIFSAGVTKEMFKIGYSFDYTISGLGINTGGSHELGITVNFEKSTLFRKEYRYSDCFNLFR